MLRSRNPPTPIIGELDTSVSLGYDLYGRTSSLSDGTGSQTFNVDNQLTGVGMAYDGAGNPTTYKAKVLTFDPENRMTSYNGTTQTNGYSGDGLRAWKQAGSTRTYFLYDGAAPVCEYNSSGTLLATNTFGADGLVSRRAVSSNVTTFYTFDERGSVSQRLSTAGAVLSSDLYDGFGTRSSTGAADVWGFEAQAGYYSDSETGLILCTHRFYDPSTGRWLTRDPMGYDGGINLYGYVGNNPGNGVDPSGTKMSKAQCAALLQSIIGQANDLLSEWAKYDPVKDGIGGFKMKYGSGKTKPGGHYIELMYFKRGLKNRITKYIEECIKDNDDNNPSVPGWCNNLSHRPISVPIFPTSNFANASDGQLAMDSVLASIAIVGIIAVTKGAGAGAATSGVVEGLSGGAASAGASGGTTGVLAGAGAL